MEFKSNIRIKSNLYIRSTADGAFSFADTDYIAQIKNHEALVKLKERADASGANLKLSESQQGILRGSKPAEGGIPTLGAARPDGTAMPETISMDGASERAASAVDSTSASSILSVSLDEVPVEKIDVGLDGFSKIASEDTAARISKAGLDSRVVLDSVCYSEKIRIAAERISFILKNYPDKRLLVLSKTDAAAERMKRAFGDGRPEDLKNSGVDTLDVFAAKYLSGLGESAAKITSLSADEKIAAFSDKMRTEDFAGYDFCIIADLDELVSDNVKMLLKILVLMECGFLLLSDKRRAALEYAPESGYNKSFAKLCDVLPEGTEKLTLIDVKHRLSDEIGGLMTAISEGRPAENAINALISKMRSADISKLSHTDGEAVVLCKDSGSAEYASMLLHRNGILHTLLREDRPAPVRQLADIFWDSHEKVIGRDNFIKRFVARCGGDEAHAEDSFNMLCGLIDRAPSEGLELSRLAEIISLGGIPITLMNVSKDKLSVAEIGSVGGRVFNTVYLADCDFGGGNNIDTESLKRLYLAASGRTEPPAMLKLGEVPELVSGSDNRYVCVSGEKAAFSLGHPRDVDFRSFIGGSMGDAVRKQAYISKNVKPGDSVTLVLNGGVYDIIHEGAEIGKMFESFSESLTAEYGGKRYLEKLPERVEGAYVTNVITVVSCCDPSEYEGVISPQFREHRFWYGVEIGGFGEAVGD